MCFNATIRTTKWPCFPVVAALDSQDSVPLLLIFAEKGEKLKLHLESRKAPLKEKLSYCKNKKDSTECSKFK